jgi:hypothetical protein
MKKVVLTESQLNMVKRHIAEEESNDRYERKVEVSVGTPTGEYRYENMVIDEITTDYDEMRLTYLIEQEHRSWGIKNISLYDIKGYDEIEVKLHLYPENSEDFDDVVIKEVKIPLDWDTLNVTTNEGKGMVTIDDRLDITIYVKDGVFSTDMSIETYTL